MGWVGGNEVISRPEVFFPAWTNRHMSTKRKSKAKAAPCKLTRGTKSFARRQKRCVKTGRGFTVNGGTKVYHRTLSGLTKDDICKNRWGMYVSCKKRKRLLNRPLPQGFKQRVFRKNIKRKHSNSKRKHSKGKRQHSKGKRKHSNGNRRSNRSRP